MSLLGAIFRETKFYLCLGLEEASHGVIMEAGHYETWLGQFPDIVEGIVVAGSSTRYLNGMLQCYLKKLFTPIR
jgi:hypothetical protein